MSEYIVELYEPYDAGYRIGEKIVRCGDCKHYKPWLLSRPENGGDCVLNKVEVDVPPDGFCAWGERANFATCECGEDIELGNCESAVCPRCNRTVRA